MALTLTDAAITRVREKRGTPDQWLKLGIRGGGCSGFMYAMDFVDEPADKDRKFEFDDVKVCVDIKSYLFLAQTTLDFEQTLMRTGFVFKNPEAAKTCSCGESFSPF
ncbi:MAG: iron-sulfur cluster assembly accessory protein [Deltaproteobacteria bacterium]|nr:MAG: iron-sulfur cluster assembly accessory protein [Deltaproteobacteria bacterium]